MVSQATDSTEGSNSFTRVPAQLSTAAQESTVEADSFVHVPNRQVVEDEDTTQPIDSSRSVTHDPDGQVVPAQGTSQEIASLTPVSDGQATEDAESTQAFTVPPHAPLVQDAIQDLTASASIDIPDRQAMGDDETTQGSAASTVIVTSGRAIGHLETTEEVTASASTDIPDRQAIGFNETAQELHASSISHSPDRHAIGDDETTQEFTASTIIQAPDRQAIGDDETTQEFTASTIIQVPDRQVVGDGESTQEFTALRQASDKEALEEDDETEEHTASNATHTTKRRAIGHEDTTQDLAAQNSSTDVPGAVQDLTASSSTHRSGKHTDEGQDMAPEVSISTSFAANLPDRQVVEADAFTPPPPLTVTTRESTALTHVTDTQAMEAHQEEHTSRRAGSASHAASTQEAAATSSSQELRSEPQATPERQDKGDERVPARSELGRVIVNASMTVPGSRLTIAYNRRFVAEDKYLSKAVTRHPQTASGWDMISVVQRADHADFIIELGYHRRPVKEVFNRLIPFPLTGQLIFQPASDNCVLRNQAGAEFYLAYLDALSTCAHELIDSLQHYVLRPGMWRISTRGEKPHEDEYHSLVEFLILPRSFTASVDGESAKRQKLSQTSLARKYQDTTMLIQELEDGQSARIRGAQDDTADYELQRVRHLASTPSACVFSCRHSKVAGVLAVKVVIYDVEAVNRFDKKSAAHLAALVAAWKRELSFLQTMNHNHIVSLKAFDCRLLALFLEQLPPSLDRGSTIKLDPSSVRSILHDISSALEYLEKRGIVHHDIKPHNIAHSPARGAVLLDFGQAAAATAFGIYGGTLAFLPPEFPPYGTRGFAGDVWALGLTALYILGKIPMPRVQLDIRIRDLYRRIPPPRFKELQDAIACQRKRLNPEDEIEGVVFRMLDPDAKARATAQTVISALNKTLLTV